MLIIEGPDCAGKTTLCHKLLEQLPAYTYSHLSRLPDSFDRYWGYVNRLNPRIVQDRFHVSEIVYTAMRGEQPTLESWQYELLDGKIREVGGYIVVLLPEAELIRSRWQPNQMYSLEQTLSVADYYESFCQYGKPFRPALDEIIYCTKEEPYPDEDAIAGILTTYTQRQLLISNIAKRKPVTL